MNTERLQYFAGMLEKHLISPEKYDETPEYVRNKLCNDGHPEGIAHHPKYGWFILFAGQGPAIGWSEMGQKELENAINDF
jgi:hypothetical protein